MQASPSRPAAPRRPRVPARGPGAARRSGRNRPRPAAAPGRPAPAPGSNQPPRPAPGRGTGACDTPRSRRPARRPRGVAMVWPAGSPSRSVPGGVAVGHRLGDGGVKARRERRHRVLGAARTLGSQRTRQEQVYRDPEKRYWNAAWWTEIPATAARCPSAAGGVVAMGDQRGQAMRHQGRVGLSLDDWLQLGERVIPLARGEVDNRRRRANVTRSVARPFRPVPGSPAPGRWPLRDGLDLSSVPNLPLISSNRRSVSCWSSPSTASARLP